MLLLLYMQFMHSVLLLMKQSLYYASIQKKRYKIMENLLESEAAFLTSLNIAIEVTVYNNCFIFGVQHSSVLKRLQRELWTTYHHLVVHSSWQYSWANAHSYIYATCPLDSEWYTCWYRNLLNFHVKIFSSEGVDEN